jgi:hypothetical protein
MSPLLIAFLVVVVLMIVVANPRDRATCFVPLLVIALVICIVGLIASLLRAFG